MQNIIISNEDRSDPTKLKATFRFQDQWQGAASVELKVGNVTINNTPFYFPFVKSVHQRNVFQLGSSTATVPVCANSFNINFSKIKYVKTGGNVNNSSDQFSEVGFYQYELPTGVTPLSGLTPVNGLPNTYAGTNNVSVNLANPFLDYTIKIRPVNECLNTLYGNWNELRLQRSQLSISGPSSINCGETDVKTFTLQGLPANPSCITTYTWQIANKGWKYNNTIPSTDIVTTVPSIQLTSADNISAPPQSISVVISNSTGLTRTITKPITFTSPSININPIVSNNLEAINCNALNFSASVINPPNGTYSFLWASNGVNALINGQASPFATNDNTVTLEKDPLQPDPINIFASIVASCGVINSGVYGGFAGCIDWSDFSVIGFADPFNGGGSLYASVSDYLGATEYEWYALYWGQYHPLGKTYSGQLFGGSSFPCVDNIDIYVRVNANGGFSQLKYVGSFGTSPCNGFRIASTTESIKVGPNPINDYINIEFENKNKPVVIEIFSWKGNKVKQVNSKNKRTLVNVSNLEKGRYVIKIKLDNKTFIKQIVK
ncbi:MAG: T9SS type A sorting domain-containing protein [Chitinophagaceae bacterium]